MLPAASLRLEAETERPSPGSELKMDRCCKLKLFAFISSKHLCMADFRSRTQPVTSLGQVWFLSRRSSLDREYFLSFCSHWWKDHIKQFPNPELFFLERLTWMSGRPLGGSPGNSEFTPLTLAQRCSHGYSTSRCFTQQLSRPGAEAPDAANSVTERTSASIEFFIIQSLASLSCWRSEVMARCCKTISFLSSCTNLPFYVQHTEGWPLWSIWGQFQ